MAAGLDHLVLDIKVGNGAFMSKLEDARNLAESLVSVANESGCSTTALITDMSEPLCSSVANSLEMSAAIDFLMGREIDNRLWEVSCSLGGLLLEKSGLSENFDEGYQKISEAFQSGRALEKFDKMIWALGGPQQFSKTFISDLPKAQFVEEIYHRNEGFVVKIDTRAIGECLVKLGGGRVKSEDLIDYSVGFDWILGVGNYADKDKPICRVHYNDPDKIGFIKQKILTAFELSSNSPPEVLPVLETIK